MAYLYSRLLSVLGTLGSATLVSACAVLGSTPGTPTATPTIAPTATPNVSVANITVTGAVNGALVGGTARTARGSGMGCQRLQSDPKYYVVTIPGQIGDKVYDVAIAISTTADEESPA